MGTQTEHSFKDNSTKDIFNVHIKRESLENVQEMTQHKNKLTNELSLEKEKVPENITKETKVPDQRPNKQKILANCDFELQKMGNFFEDSFFTDMHQHFHSAVKS